MPSFNASEYVVESPHTGGESAQSPSIPGKTKTHTTTAFYNTTLWIVRLGGAHTLTRALRAGDQSLARVAHLEDGGCLDVVPLLEGHGVHPARQPIRVSGTTKRTEFGQNSR